MTREARFAINVGLSARLAKKKHCTLSMPRKRFIIKVTAEPWKIRAKFEMNWCANFRLTQGTGPKGHEGLRHEASG